MKLMNWAASAAIAGALAFSGVGDAFAQEKRVRIQMGGAFPSSTGLLGPTQLALVDNIKKLSQGTIDIRFFEPGALVPAGQYFDAVGNGSLDAAWTVSGFFTGKDIAFAMYAAVPFGPEMGEYLGWMKHGGGLKLYEELHMKYNIVAIPCGVIAPEASGWFRKEIKSLDDLKGLKMRFFGLGANVMQKMGVATQLLQAGEIFQALQLGTIDATEFSMPVMDLTLGFHQVAKHYYFPGWHQMSTINSLYLSKSKWDELSDWQKLVVRTACDQTMLNQYVEGESVQAKALKEIQSKGVTLHYWPKEVLAAFKKTWDEVAAEQMAKSPEFKKAWDSYSAFRADYAIWKDLGYLKN
jgi:TRAP-type mannitol/chloroaromatic compound transport system substrate-binding protein